MNPVPAGELRPTELAALLHGLLRIVTNQDPDKPVSVAVRQVEQAGSDARRGTLPCGRERSTVRKPRI